MARLDRGSDFWYPATLPELVQIFRTRLGMTGLAPGWIS